MDVPVFTNDLVDSAVVTVADDDVGDVTWFEVLASPPLELSGLT